MQLAIKILLIVSCVLGVCAIAPTVVGIIALGKIKQGKPSMAMSIVTLVLCNPIVGVLMLISKDSDYVTAAE